MNKYPYNVSPMSYSCIYAAWTWDYWPPWKIDRLTEHADSEEDARNVAVEQVKILDEIGIQNTFKPSRHDNIPS